MKIMCLSISWIRAKGFNVVGFLFATFLVCLITAWLLKTFWLLLLAAFFALVLLAYFAKGIRNSVISIAAIVLTLSIAELLLNSFSIGDETDNYFDSKSSYAAGGYFHKNTDLGYQPTTGKHTSRKLMSNGKVIYDVTYTIGPDGFRVTNQSLLSKGRINFFGGSFVFGEGLNDDETLPYYLTKALNTNVQNFGVHGYGVHQALAIMEREQPPNGDVNILLTGPWHALRSACKRSYTRGTPRYLLQSENRLLVREGRCPGYGLISDVLHESKIFLLLQRIRGKKNITNKDIELYVELINRMHELSKSRNQKFIVAFIKNFETSLQSTSYSNDDIIEFLASMSDDFVDVTLGDSRDELMRKYYIHELDHHPSSIANFERAKLISTLFN
jgi:hypothetical protein